MPTKPKGEDRRLETGAHSISPSTVYSQPWWHGVGNGAMPSSMEHVNGSAITGGQSEVNGLNGNNDQGQKHLKHVASSTPPVIGENLGANSQMELVGHSIVLTSYPYQDPHYGGIMTYGPQVHPHLFGIHQTRMPLPLDMEEEPVYVNAKQYHGILRRRQLRAKAELEKKAIKSRKPYLHESRHQHAMRRARGCGGRFLNTKKLDCNATNPISEKEPKSGTTASTNSVNSSGSEHLSTSCDGNSDLQEEKGPLFQDVHKMRTLSNGSSNNGHGLSSMYRFQSMDNAERRGCFDQERGTPHGAAPFK